MIVHSNIGVVLNTEIAELNQINQFVELIRRIGSGLGFYT